MPDQLSYDELKEQLDKAPPTWVPALFIALVYRAVRAKVFVKGGLVKLVQTAIDDAERGRS